MGYVTKLCIARSDTLQQVADGSAAQFLSSGPALESLTDMALVRLQALVDGVTGWDERFDAVAIEFESQPYAESRVDDGGWSRLLPERFIRSVAALSDANIERLLPAWAHPDTHAGERISLVDASTMLRAVRELCSRARQQGSALIFSTRE